MDRVAEEMEVGRPLTALPFGVRCNRRGARELTPRGGCTWWCAAHDPWRDPFPDLYWLQLARSAVGTCDNRQVRLVEVRLDDPPVRPLLDGLADEYRSRYGSNEELAGTTPEQFDAPAGVFLVLVDDEGRTIAGGGIRRVDAETCEVKRLWTVPDSRRRGHALAVLTALEDAARKRGYVRVKLETGPLQPEAIAMYRTRGYRPIPAYGRYEGAFAFEMDLDQAAGRRLGGPRAV